MGLGVTPNSNWPSNDDFKALQIGTGACVFGRGSGDEDRGGIAVNYYHTGSAEKYLANGNASGMLLNDGDVDFFVAGANSSGADAAMSKTVAMRIAADADIGIGTLDPEGRLHIIGGNLSGAGSVTAATDANLLVLESNESNGMSFINANDERAVIRFGTTGTGGQNEASISYAHEAVSTTNDRRCMIFKSGGNSERMRIDSIGRLLHGCTSAGGGTSEGQITIEFPGNSRNAIKTRDTDNTGTVNHMVFVSGSAAVGTITGTTGQAFYNNLSDYRSKENDVKITDGIEKIKLLRPIRFNYKADKDTLCDGFFAHEVTAAVPTAVQGEKDAVDSKGEIDPQMLDTGKIIPVLTAALQEAITKIETLEAEVASLKSS
tara:strand:- start:42 stop:1169 length:1128 start_codon:yes stop_codon:yes gene_type:complete